MAPASDLERLLDELAVEERVTVSARGAVEGPARSYLADGRQVTWTLAVPPGLVAAVDAELADQEVPATLATRFGVTDPGEFWPTWTAVEVSCKLLDASLLVWLSQRGLEPDPQVPRRVLRVGPVVVCCGLLAADDRRRPWSATSRR